MCIMCIMCLCISMYVDLQQYQSPVCFNYHPQRLDKNMEIAILMKILWFIIIVPNEQYHLTSF